MALLIEQTTDVAEVVAAAVVDAYGARRERVQLMSLDELIAGAATGPSDSLTAVVAGESRVAEIVVDADAELTALVPATWTLAGRGWDVFVLVPCNRIGDAHSSLRAAPCRLQPWWIDDDGVWFGAPETP